MKLGALALEAVADVMRRTKKLSSEEQERERIRLRNLRIRWVLVILCSIGIAVWLITTGCATSCAGSQSPNPKANTTDVGIWYCTYYHTKPTDNWDQPYASSIVKYRPLCSAKKGDFRKYDADDPAVIDFHLAQIAKAKIDFLLFECTPGGLGGYRDSTKFIVDRARAVCKRIKVWNDNPRHTWKMRYAVAAGCHPDVWDNKPGYPAGQCMEAEARDVFETFVNNPGYGGPDNYYRLDGKPLLVYWGWPDSVSHHWATYTGSKQFGDHFTMRPAAGCAPGEYGWNIPSTGTVLHAEVEVVSPAWGHYARKVPPYVARRHGDFYRECWDRVLNHPLPKIIMIVSFNDYWENTAVWTADTANLTDADKWTDSSGKLNPSMYWDLTKEYVAKLRHEPLQHRD